MAESRRKLPCPCGRKRLYTYYTWNHEKHWTYIKCPKCGKRTEEFPSEIAAIREWNRMVEACGR